MKIEKLSKSKQDTSWWKVIDKINEIISALQEEEYCRCGTEKELEIRVEEIIFNWVEEHRDYMMSTGVWAKSLATALLTNFKISRRTQLEE